MRSHSARRSSVIMFADDKILAVAHQLPTATDGIHGIRSSNNVQWRQLLAPASACDFDGVSNVQFTQSRKGRKVPATLAGALKHPGHSPRRAVKHHVFGLRSGRRPLCARSPEVIGPGSSDKDDADREQHLLQRRALVERPIRRCSSRRLPTAVTANTMGRAGRKPIPACAIKETSR